MTAQRAIVEDGSQNERNQRGEHESDGIAGQVQAAPGCVSVLGCKRPGFSQDNADGQENPRQKRLSARLVYAGALQQPGQKKQRRQVDPRCGQVCRQHQDSPSAPIFLSVRVHPVSGAFATRIKRCSWLLTYPLRPSSSWSARSWRIWVVTEKPGNSQAMVLT